MAVKTPKLFAGEFTEEQFQKKLLKRIYIKEYTEFLNKVFSKNPEGHYILKKELDKKEALTLKKIGKSIKQNTGFVLKGKLVVVLIILGAVIAFNILFKDMLVERAAEAGLTAVFQAQSDIHGLKFQILKGRIYMDSLEVADSEKPFSNLFELGKTEVAVNMLEILKGNVIIENIESQEIRWDTKRSTSGALPGRQAPPPVEEKTGDSQAASDPFAFLGKTGDAVAGLIEKEKANLKSLALLDELTGKYPALTEKWSAKSGDLSRNLESLSPAMNAVTGIKVDSIKTVEEAEKAFTTIQTAYTSVEALKKDVGQAYAELGKDLETAKKDKQAVTTAIDGDYRYLGSFISLASGGGGSFVTPLIESLLGKNVARIYSYARRGLSYVLSLKPRTKEKTAEAPRDHARGFFVHFPANVHPNLWLKKMGVSLGDKKADYSSGGMKDITSDPDLVGAPTTFSFMNKQGAQQLGITGAVDGRTGKDTVFDGAARLESFAVSIAEGLQSLKIEKLECSSDADLRISIDSRNRTSGTLALSLRKIKITGSASQDEITARVIRALEAATEVSIQAGYSFSETGAMEMDIKSNLDRIIGDIVAGAVADLTREAQKQLKTELDKLLGDKLGNYDSLYADLLKSDASLLDSQKDLGGYGKVLDDKKKQVDAQVARIQKDLTGKAADELNKLKGKLGF